MRFVRDTQQIAHVGQWSTIATGTPTPHHWQRSSPVACAIGSAVVAVVAVVAKRSI
jgi:hypothetical protein